MEALSFSSSETSKPAPLAGLVGWHPATDETAKQTKSNHERSKEHERSKDKRGD